MNTTQTIVAFLRNRLTMQESEVLPTLPTELLECIVDLSSDDMSTLLSLSLTCRRLVTRSQMHIFSNFRFCSWCLGFGNGYDCSRNIKRFTSQCYSLRLSSQGLLSNINSLHVNLNICFKSKLRKDLLLLLPNLISIRTVVMSGARDGRRDRFHHRLPGIYELLRAIPRTTHCRLVCREDCLHIDNAYRDIITLRSDDFPTTYDLRSMVLAGVSALPLNSRPVPWAAYLPDSVYQEDQLRKLTEFFGSASAVNKSNFHTLLCGLVCLEDLFRLNVVRYITNLSVALPAILPETGILSALLDIPYYTHPPPCS